MDAVQESGHWQLVFPAKSPASQPDRLWRDDEHHQGMPELFDITVRHNFNGPTRRNRYHTIDIQDP